MRANCLRLVPPLDKQFRKGNARSSGRKSRMVSMVNGDDRGAVSSISAFVRCWLEPGLESGGDSIAVIIWTDDDEWVRFRRGK